MGWGRHDETRDTEATEDKVDEGLYRCAGLDSDGSHLIWPMVSSLWFPLASGYNLSHSTSLVSGNGFEYDSRLCPHFLLEWTGITGS